MKRVSLSSAWEESLGFIRQEAGLLFPVALLFISIPIALILQMIPAELRELTQSGPRPNVSVSPVAVLVICASAMVILGGTLSCYALAARPGISLREALVLGFRRIPPALGGALMLGLVLVVPMMVLSKVSPHVANLYTTAATLFFTVKFLFLNLVIVDRLEGPVVAMRRSWAMTRGNVGRLLLLIVGLTIPIMLAQTVAEILLGLIGFALGGAEVGKQMSDLAAAVVLSLGQVFMIVLTTKVYRQLSQN